MQKTALTTGQVGMPTKPASMAAYEEHLANDPRWALSEGSRFFEGKSTVQAALLKITNRLRDLKIEYAVAGGMAVFLHGFRRFTEDVDLLVTPESIADIHRQLAGLGYVPIFAGARNLRDAELGVRIEFIVTGDYPGDGKPKPVAFPSPGHVAIEKDGIRYVNLPTLIELKIASGITSPERLKDLADVQELIKVLRLPCDFAGGLNPYVRAKFAELWAASMPLGKRYVRLLPFDPKTAVVSMNDLIALDPKNAAILTDMKSDGVIVDTTTPPPSGFIRLFTPDASVAAKYDMHDESEFLDVEQVQQRGKPDPSS